MLVLGSVSDINRITREEITDPTISHHLGPLGFFSDVFLLRNSKELHLNQPFGGIHRHHLDSNKISGPKTKHQET